MTQETNSSTDIITSPQRPTRGNDEQVTASHAVASLPQVPLGIPSLSSSTGSAFNASGQVQSVDWQPSLDNAIPNLMWSDERSSYGMSTASCNDYMIGNLLQTSFDSWAALEGTFQQPMDTEIVW